MGYWPWLHHPNTQWSQGSKEITDEIANWLPYLPQRSSSTIPLSRLPEHHRGKKTRKHKQSRRIMWLCIEPWSQGSLKALRVSDSDPALMDRWRYIMPRFYFGYGNVSNTMVNLVTLPILGRFKDDSINPGERIIYPSPIVWALGEWFPSKTVLTCMLSVVWWKHVSSDHLINSLSWAYTFHCDTNNEAKSGCQNALPQRKYSV